LLLLFREMQRKYSTNWGEHLNKRRLFDCLSKFSFLQVGVEHYLNFAGSRGWVTVNKK
jgi:hypothetical protein